MTDLEQAHQPTADPANPSEAANPREAAHAADGRTAGLSRDEMRPIARKAVPRAYVIFDLDITDPDAYEDYRLHGQAAVRRWGGRVLSGEPAPRGVVECLEGDWVTKRLVVVEFASIAVARAWYASPEYRDAIAMRQASSNGRVLLVEGWKGAW